MPAIGAANASGTGEVAGISEGMVELVMFTATTLVALVSTGSTGVVIVYDAGLVVAGDDVPIVVGVEASVVDKDDAPVVGETVVVFKARAVGFGKAGQVKLRPFSTSKKDDSMDRQSSVSTRRSANLQVSSATKWQSSCV